jgi:hypothetical protein
MGLSFSLIPYCIYIVILFSMPCLCLYNVYLQDGFSVVVGAQDAYHPEFGGV